MWGILEDLPLAHGDCTQVILLTSVGGGLVCRKMYIQLKGTKKDILSLGDNKYTVCCVFHSDLSHEVRYGIFHLRNYINGQNVLGFGFSD